MKIELPKFDAQQATAKSLQPDEIRAELKLGDRNSPEGAKQAARQFEALLVNEMMKSMRTTEMESGLFSSESGKMYREMLDTQLAQRISEAGGIGLANVIYQQLVRSALDGSEAEDNLQPVSTAVEKVVAPLPRVSASGPGRTVDVAKSHRTEMSPGARASVELRLPLEGRISSGFGMRRDPINGARRQHQGVDIAAPRGTPIRAAADGVVVFSGRQRGYGRTVVIEHADGTRTRYAHAERLLVKAGDTVSGQQEIAAVGNTGRATGPHLHFEVERDGKRIDPASLFAQVPALARR